MRKSTTLIRQLGVRIIGSLLVLLVLVTPVLYYITTSYYAEDLIRIIHENGIQNPHLDLQRDTLTGMFIQFFVIVIVIMLAMLFVMQHVPQRLWHPFRVTLDRIASFKVENGQIPVLPETNVKEFQQLNAILTKMMTESANSYQVQKEFTENASHELQTPLAVAMVEIDNLQQDPTLTPKQAAALQNIYVELRQMSRLSRNLLLLSKIENNQYRQGTKVNLVEKINALLPLWQNLCVGRQLDFVHESSQMMVDCNEVLLESLLNNLVVNAIRHSDDGGAITIQLKDGCLDVANTSTEGPLDRQKIFSRFYRSKLTQKGNGLGLAIVKSICDYHYWQINYQYLSQQHHFIIRFVRT